jgi:AraC-like DNA-binding protein
MDRLPGAWVIEAFKRGGVDIGLLTQRIPDDVDALIYHMDTLSLNATNRLLDCCADISDNPDFGLALNEWVDPSMYGLLGYLLLNSGTVNDLFNTLERYYTVHHDGGDYYKVVINKDTVSLQYGFNLPTTSSSRHAIEWALGFIPLHLKAPLGNLAKPLKAQFTYNPPNKLEKLQSTFGHDLTFNCPQNQLTYPISILNKPIADSDPGLLGILRDRADKALHNHLKNESLQTEIHMLLIEYLEDDKADATDIAKALNVSLSTFKRKLADENINFKEMKESIKNDIAKRMLSQTKIGLAQIAQKTGFTNQSSFTRFFIRCNQQKPLEYRVSKYQRNTD